MAIVQGGKYQHRLTGRPCKVTAYHGERHRATIELDNGVEIQEVPFHDLLDLPKGAPEAGPLPVQMPGPDDTEGTPREDPAERANETPVEDQRHGWPPPRREA